MTRYFTLAAIACVAIFIASLLVGQTLLASRPMPPEGWSFTPRPEDLEFERSTAASQRNLAAASWAAGLSMVGAMIFLPLVAISALARAVRRAVSKRPAERPAVAVPTQPALDPPTLLSER